MKYTDEGEEGRRKEVAEQK